MSVVTPHQAHQGNTHTHTLLYILYGCPVQPILVNSTHYTLRSCTGTDKQAAGCENIGDIQWCVYSTCVKRVVQMCGACVVCVCTYVRTHVLYIRTSVHKMRHAHTSGFFKDQQQTAPSSLPPKSRFPYPTATMSCIHNIHTYRYVHAHTHTNTHMHTCTHIHVHMHTHTRTRTHTRTHTTHARTHTHTRTHTHARTHTHTRH